MPAKNLQAAMRDVEHIRQKCAKGQVGPTRMMLADQRKLLEAIRWLAKLNGELVDTHMKSLDKIGHILQGKGWER